MSRNRVNLPFITSARTQHGAKIFCCVPAGERDRVSNILESDDLLTGLFDLTPNTGLLSLFPTRSGLDVLGAALSTFTQAGISLYGAASSFSSLVFVTDFAQLLPAVHAFQDRFDVPPHRAPVKPEFRIRQSRLVKEE
jgi:hypothetical protein